MPDHLSWAVGAIVALPQAQWLVKAPLLPYQHPQGLLSYWTLLPPSPQKQEAKSKLLVPLPLEPIPPPQSQAASSPSPCRKTPPK